MAEEKKYKKKSKEQVYKELQNINADNPYTYIDPIREHLYNQIKAVYPEKEQTNAERINTYKNLANDMDVGNISIAPLFSARYHTLPTYLHKGEEYDIDELPKESNPHSLTSFLGRFDPFRNEVPLTKEDRMRDPLKYAPRMESVEQGLVGLGKAKDFRAGRVPAEMEDDYNFRRASSDDPRLVNSAFLKVNPKTLDEMIERPGTGIIRFKAIQDRLAKEKIKQKALDSVKEQLEDEEIEKLMKEK